MSFSPLSFFHLLSHLSQKKPNVSSDQQKLQKLWGPIHCLQGGGHFS